MPARASGPVHDVVIIGGGVAGLAAAGRLRAGGLDVVLVEARLRLGGRVHSSRGDGWPAPVEEGAEFVHGRDPALWKLLRAARLGADPVPEAHWLRVGRSLADGAAVWEQAQLLMGDDGFRNDRSIIARIDAARPTAPVRAMALAYVEGFYAAEARRASARNIFEQTAAAAAISGEQLFRVRQGYDGVVAWLARGAGREGQEVRLATIVERVRWRRGHIEVQARSALRTPLPPLRARRLLVTLPLGVLQARPGAAAVRFVPSLPAEKRRAIAAMAVGDVVKVAVRFAAAPWLDHEARLGPLSMVHARPATIPTWWRPLPYQGPMLMGWAGGPAARQLTGRPPAQIARRALVSLGRTLGCDTLPPLAQAWHVVDWAADPFAAGAYSWIPVGAGAAPAVLAASVGDTLYFAGEATQVGGAGGTVHGALGTGLRAADEILAAARAGA
jgi:monoamine oxidase